MQPASLRVESHRAIWQLTSCMISVVSLVVGKRASLESIIKDCTCPTLLRYLGKIPKVRLKKPDCCKDVHRYRI